MLASLAVPVLLATAALAHSPRFEYHKRQVTASSTSTTSSSTGGDSSVLSQIVALGAGTNCTTETDQVTRAVAGCIAANSGDALQAVACACGTGVLNITVRRLTSVLPLPETAATCISSDPAGNGTVALQDYNNFVNQCISLNLANSSSLASISGVVVTTAVPTTTVLTTTSSSSASSGASSVSANVTSIATATGSVSSAASSQVSSTEVTETVAASSAAAAEASASATGAAGKVRVAVGALAVVAGAVAVLA
ncbi:hypothetical protein JCM8547_007172 [Rhodosporidiobolus lusitaniae]